MRPDVDTQRPVARIFAHLAAEAVTLYIDTSGEPLFKRGWRTGAADAPLRENLAAGIIMLTGWKPEMPHAKTLDDLLTYWETKIQR